MIETEGGFSIPLFGPSAHDFEDGPRPPAGALPLPDYLEDEPVQLLYRDESGARGTLDLSNRARTTIGRDGKCDIVFRDAHVSRVHATIELVQGQHLLRDPGSSNGTFLNGLRLSAQHAFALRARDLIEVGSQRIHFVRAGDPGTPPEGAKLDLGGSAHELADLARDGLEALGADGRKRLHADLLAAFLGVTAARGIQRVLPLVLQRVDAHVAAIFMEDRRHGLRAAAALPAFESAGPLMVLALRSRADGKGHVLRGLAPLEMNETSGTCVQSQSTQAAVPIHDGGVTRGVIAVERHGGSRLARRDLGVLVVIGEAVARTLALKEARDSGDTRT